MPIPNEIVAAKSLSKQPIFLERINDTIQTTGKERNAAARMLGALVKRVVKRILAPRRTIAVLIKSSALHVFLSQFGICKTFVMTKPCK
jgi:hypothetical protein